MTSYIVVFGLIVVVVLVVVLVALGLRASRAGRDDDWMDDEPQQQPRGRRGVPPPPDDMGGHDDGYGPGYDQGYGGAAPDPAYDRRVAGGPLAAPAGAPAPSPPPPPAHGGPASDEMEDDDYWATITFDKPKFPWQHDQEAGGSDPAADPLNAQHAPQQPGQATQHVQPPEQQPAIEHPGLTQPVALGADGTVLNGLGGPGTGPQQVPAQGGFQGAPYGSEPYAADPGATSLDPIPADLGALGGPSGTGPQSPYGMPDQQVYGGQEPQPAYGAADQYDPSYGGGTEQFGGHGDQPHYGGQDQSGYGDQPQYGVPDQPQYGSQEPSYPDFGSDPLGSRPAGAPSGGGRTDGFDLPLGASAPQPPAQHPAPPASDPLGLPLGRTDEPGRGFGDSTGGLPGASEVMPPAPPAPAPAAPAAHAGLGSGASGSDTDNHKLPTVDELLQRIQTDRQRTAGGPSSDSGGYGGLNDPLNDPLGTGSFGTGSAGTGSGTGPWPPPASGGSSGAGAPGGGYDSGYGSSGAGSGSGGYGQGSHTDGYPTAPAYGESPRYDDPLSGGSREPYGSGGQGGGQGGGTGAYGDFSGSSYNGNDPLAAPHDPGATQAYGSGYPGAPQQGGYQQQGGLPSDTNPYDSRQQPDDWENYRR
ncbi:hypothetical protein [Actinomadura sp. NTSP31]|uniref:hypothetical protein n=1 Tax=Actinomadura sp. NTSP31 TaxID=1735447 RepID=UPI0035BFDCDE